MQDDKNEATITDTVVFLTMTVGIGEITAANAEEFFTRVHMEEQAFGARCHKCEGEKVIPCPLTLANIQRRIGLSTNASRKSAIQYGKDVADRLRGRAEDAIRYEREEAATKAATEESDAAAEISQS